MSWRALREARRYVAMAAALDLALFAVRRRGAGRLLLGAACVLSLFFRDPERRVADDEGLVFAPADGVVTAVERAGDPWMEDEEALRITTFLSLHNVHVTRSPVSGRIVDEEAVAGGYSPAFSKRAGENHRKRIAIETARGRVVLVQVAGLVARRISSWVGAGDTVAAGQRVALIHFGSRADVLLPAARVEPVVRPGARVRAGETALARYTGGEVARA